MIHKNSKEAYKIIMESGRKESRHRFIIKILTSVEQPLTDYTILQYYKKDSDNLNLVRPRITELHNDGILQEGPPAKSHEGNLNVRTSIMNPDLIKKQMSLF